MQNTDVFNSLKEAFKKYTAFTAVRLSQVQIDSRKSIF